MFVWTHVFLSACLISCWLLGWVAPSSCSPQTSSPHHLPAQPSSSQSQANRKAVWGHSRVCKSGVKLKKHTQWACRWGATTRSEGESSRHTCTHAQRNTPTQRVCALVGSWGGFSSPFQHFVLSLCSRRRWSVCYVKFYVPAIWHWSWRQLTCFLSYSSLLWLIHTYTHLQNRGSLINLWHSVLWRKPQI